MDPLYKSRLVACGNYENAEIRSDSPTASQETVCWVLSFAACHKVRVRSADITNAYFHGERLSPGRMNLSDLRPAAARHLTHPRPEDSVDADEYSVAWLQEIDEASLHPRRARS